MILATKTKSVNLLLALVMVVFFTTLQSSSCSKSDDLATINTNTTPIAGSWRVSLYWDKKDETNKLNGYSFSFNSGGQVTATKAGVVVNGTWSESSNKFTINFGADPVLSDINDDWQKIEKTATSIKLKDDNPLQDDQLTFIKN
jgi:hypothetical protein